MLNQRCRMFALAALMWLPVACDSEERAKDSSGEDDSASGKGHQSRKKSKSKSSKKKSGKTEKTEKKGSTSDGTKKGCQLITQEDAEKVFGEAVEAGKRKAPNCAWDIKKLSGGMTIDILDATPAKMTKGNKKTVAGIGDDAFFSTNSRTHSIITAIKGDKAVMIAVMFPMKKPSGIKDTGTGAEKLAKIAIGKL